MDGATVSVLRLTLYVRRGSIKFTAGSGVTQLLQIPAYGLWQLWVGILQPYLTAPRQQEPVESQAERARQERTEKRAQRRSQRYT